MQYRDICHEKIRGKRHEQAASAIWARRALVGGLGRSRSASTGACATCGGGDLPGGISNEGNRKVRRIANGPRALCLLGTKKSPAVVQHSRNQLPAISESQLSTSHPNADVTRCRGFHHHVHPRDSFRFDELASWARRIATSVSSGPPDLGCLASSSGLQTDANLEVPW